MTVFLTDQDRETGQSMSVDEAYAVLLLHVAGQYGFCLGCMDVGRLASVPCPTARHAVSVVETHGVTIWDAAATGGSFTAPAQRRSTDADADFTVVAAEGWYRQVGTAARRVGVAIVASCTNLYGWREDLP